MKMIKYNCLNKIAACGLDNFDDRYASTDNMDEADVVLVRSAAMHDMEFSKNLEAIARAGAGVNNIPIDRCAEEGIVVFNTPGANANAVKELVMAGLFLASRDVVGGINWVQENKADENIAKSVEKNKSKFAGNEIQGKKLGVIGLGAIGVLVANTAVKLGMEVYGCDPYISVGSAWNLSRSVVPVKDRNEIFKECDYITIHAPLLEDTKHMINKETLDMMKDGVIILNFARDLLVNDDDLKEALESGKVRRYVTDFPNAKTANMDKVIAIPHLGASTEESEDNCAMMAVKELRDYVEYGTITNSVNYPNCDAGAFTSDSRLAINHKNIPNMISQFTTILSNAGINIENMTNKSRNEYAYTVLDIAKGAGDDVVKALESIDGVLKVRVIK